jgi:LPS export ABC transporter protein LptC
MAIRHIFKITITALAVICFLGCTDNLKEIAKLNAVSSQPTNEVENLLLKHTDSSRLKVTLQGRLMLDFAKDAFPYREFPKGIKVEVYESGTDTTKKTTITADYAVIFPGTDLVDMNGNVKIVAADGSTFYGQQLYWDQKAKWILTDQPFRTELNNNNRTTGDILDSNQKLSNALVRNASDQFYVKPKDE